MTSNDPILESDLNAYVDDQLAVGRRIEVEAYLSERPEIAAQIMKDLRVRDELRLALADHRAVTRQATREAARLLERSLARRRIFSVFRRAAAIALFVAAGWTAHAVLGPFGATEVIASTPPPAFVEEAVRAHKTTLIRDAMSSQPEAADTLGIPVGTLMSRVARARERLRTFEQSGPSATVTHLKIVGGTGDDQQ